MLEKMPTNCCTDFRLALSTDIIRNRNSRYYLYEERTANDGDGHFDTWEDKTMRINYCPFCGRALHP